MAKNKSLEHRMTQVEEAMSRIGAFADEVRPILHTYKETAQATKDNFDRSFGRMEKIEAALYGVGVTPGLVGKVTLADSKLDNLQKSMNDKFENMEKQRGSDVWIWRLIAGALLAQAVAMIFGVGS